MKRRAEGIELDAHGHAEHGAIGHDIVCAGVSALLYGLWAYLEEQIQKSGKGFLDVSEGDGRLYVQTREVEGDEAAFAVTAAGLTLIAQAFPEAVRFTWVSEDAICREEYHDGITR